MSEMKPLVIITVALFIAQVPRSSWASEESASLSLLVSTLNNTKDPNIRAALMRGMLSGLAGRRDVTPPEGWAKLSRELAESELDETRELSMQLSQIFGDGDAIQRALKLVKDNTAEPRLRRIALRSLLTQQNAQISAILESLLDDPQIRLDAVRGYASIENNAAPKILLSRYPDWDPTLRRAVIETLATRKPYAEPLLKAIEIGDVERAAITAHVARSLNLLLGDSFAKVFGEVRDLSADRTELLAKYKSICTPEAIADADATRGRAVFEKTCASCHLLYGAGGKIGPDLTGSNRANLDYILLNSVDPSYDVPDGYKMVLIQTVDGRLLNGVIAEEDATRVVLKTVEQPQVVIPKDDIEARKISTKSMMPDGQLDQMKKQEVIDLIKYLRTTEQVELQK
ncbi:MAG: c-type cytochrome [Rubripirellula sp.]|nr:c-type cytochrome [Rubripirellula sp.]